ncbi:autotransporter domain-containing protein [Bradyrhizobium ontarionense]|uniref:Autotransporter domain-containing protein n=1 Tax=Bradyrhizobium ontarionense TaxID=2898149 RepID=A0ABY3R3U5_9BRAD|nr:autotransporter outer membrane beta-barrel domain-containing protein [Bradyrhizobium sp. A19]UFZ01727.1 autotransporter domain-containing protein [Bradyrhizobium sp. A19]
MKLQVGQGIETLREVGTRCSRFRYESSVSALALGLAVLALGTGAASADCTPAAADSVTATCSGTTTNQGAGAPGTSGSTYGYGTGVETAVTVNVATGATVSGVNAGLNLHDGSIFNSGTITGTTFEGIQGFNLAIVNAAGATITGHNNGIDGFTAFVIVNSGTISGSSAIISPFGSGIITNNAGGLITGTNGGIAGGHGTQAIYNAGTISGGSVGVSVDNGSLVYNTGTISGGIFSIAITGSSIVNAGTINGVVSLTGATNTLTLLPGSVINGNVAGSPNNILQLGGSGTATFDISQLGYTAQYRAFSTFNKIDNSAWTLTGTSTYSGDVNVNGGNLRIDGNLASAASTTVNASGTLSGIGTVGRTTVASGGILAPGSGVAGTSLNVSGNLAFQSGAIYLVQVSPTAASTTNVSGTVTLGGATVNVAFAPGDYVAKSYTILTATGGVSGSFASTVAANSTTLTRSLSYDANNVYLNVALGYSGLAGLSGNQGAVGNALTHAFNAGGGIPAVYASLTPSGLTQASGQLGASTQQTTFGAMGQFMGLLTDPAQRSATSSPGGTTGYAEEDDRASAYAARRRSDAFAMVTKAPAAAFASRWSVWAAGFGGSQTTDGNAVAGSTNTASSLYGTAVGADYLISPNTQAGFALAGGGTNFSVTGQGWGRSDLFQAGAYLRHVQGPAYVSAALAYGWQNVTTDRIVTIAGTDHLSAAFNANAYSGRIEGGTRFVAPWIGGIGLTPYAAAQVTAFDLPAYTEHAVAGGGAFALAYAARTSTDTRTELGLRSDKSFAMQDAVLTLRGRVAWAHDFNPNRAVAATFQALPAASFVVNGAAQASDSALTTASAEMKWTNGWSAAATFEGEFSNVTRSYAGKGVVRYAW